MNGTGSHRPATWDLREGTELGPGLRSLRQLGASDTHEVYAAWDEDRATVVAVKLLLPHLVKDPRAREDLLREGTMLRSLEHPVLPRCFGIDVDAEVPWLAIEHVDGPRLSTLIRRQRFLAVEQVVPLLQQVAGALHYMAGCGSVHLDVKPKNVIMAPPPRLIDLSIARSIERARTTAGPIGTDAYMAPEQCGGDRTFEIGPAADVWGLGVTLYESLTGSAPFPPGERGGTLEDRFPQLRSLPAPVPNTVPGDLATLIDATLEKRPPDRPTASEIVDALDPVIEHAPRSLLLGKFRVATWKPARRERSLSVDSRESHDQRPMS